MTNIRPEIFPKFLSKQKQFNRPFYYICPECQIVITSREELREHYRQ